MYRVSCKEFKFANVLPLVTVFNEEEEEENNVESWLDHQKIYFKMRRECKDDWKKFFPKANIMWLKCLLANLIEHKPCGTNQVSYDTKQPTYSKHMNKLKSYFEHIYSFDSAEKAAQKLLGESNQVANNCFVSQRKNRLETADFSIQQILDLSCMR